VSQIMIDLLALQQEEIESLRKRLSAAYDKTNEEGARLCSECAHSSLARPGDRELFCHHKAVEADDSLVLSGLRANACTLNERSKRKGGPCGIKGALWESKT